MHNDKEYVSKLFPRKRNQVRNTLIIDGAYDMNVFAPFVHNSLKRSSIYNSKFSASNLAYSAWSESHFYKTDFLHCKMNGVNMQMCVFDSCKFANIESFGNVSLCNSLFKKCKFENIVLRNCVLTDATFISCTFINCKFQSSSFDGTKFDNCNFTNLVARNLNFDYSQYRNCYFANSQISLFQIGYTIGLLQCLVENKNSVLAFQGRSITTDEFYSNYINYLVEYFTDREDFFPLSNILFFRGLPSAKSNILNGIKQAICSQKYRLVLHYCELINYYNCLSSIEKREIIDVLNSNIKALSINQNILEAVKYSVLIEHYLLDKYDNIPHYYISIETDYDVYDSNIIYSLISELDDMLVLEQGNLGEHNITITHNSPLWLDILLAVGGGIIASYLKEQVLDRLILKIKEAFDKRKINLKKITIKCTDKSDAIIVEKNKNDTK